jgi:exosortase/archaeosortase family protein
MRKISKRGKNKTAPGFRAGLLSWYQGKQPILRYAGLFAGTVFLFCILTLTPVYQSLLEKEVVWSAKLAHGILSAFSGGGSVVSGATLLRGEEAILEVKPRCSGLHFCWLLCAAILPFPAPWGLRMAGAVLGFLILVGLNILRVITLFLVGCHYPGWFPAVHEQVWPVVSLLATMLLMGAWLVWVKRREE